MRPIHPRVEEPGWVGWVVEIRRRRRVSPPDWFIAVKDGGYAVFFSLEEARRFRRMLRESRTAGGRRDFPHVRVRRATLRAWGAAV